MGLYARRPGEFLWSKYLGYTDGQMVLPCMGYLLVIFGSATVKCGGLVSFVRLFLTCGGSGAVMRRVMPAALVPRPWDFVDPPIAIKPGRSMTPGPATHDFLSLAVAPAASPEPPASGPGGTEAIAEMDGVEGAGAFSAEARNGEAEGARGDEDDELEDQRENDRGSEAEVATMPVVETPATVPRHEADTDIKDN